MKKNEAEYQCGGITKIWGKICTITYHIFLFNPWNAASFWTLKNRVFHIWQRTFTGSREMKNIVLGGEREIIYFSVKKCFVDIYSPTLDYNITKV